MADIAYREVLAEARRQLGIRTIFAVRRDAVRGQYAGVIDAPLIEAAIPDYRERIFYVSGPQGMVKAVSHTLARLGVHRSRIRTDFFPGFA
jgi:ferredoxin-NADP reductase